MASITKHINHEVIEANAIPSNIAYGTAMYTRGGVEIIKTDDNEIEGWTGGLSGKSIEGGGSRRRVTFTIKKGKLHWNCTGNPKNHQIFCKHCVALALKVIDDKS